VVPYGLWFSVTDPCPGCGKRLSGIFRQKLVGDRDENGAWTFRVFREFRCRTCHEHLTSDD
jgi:hypothetical protein